VTSASWRSSTAAGGSALSILEDAADPASVSDDAARGVDALSDGGSDIHLFQSLRAL
jgi:hypothetical protein